MQATPTIAKNEQKIIPVLGPMSHDKPRHSKSNIFILKGTVSVHRQSVFLNLASGNEVKCEFSHPSVGRATTTSDRRNDFEYLCSISKCLATMYVIA